MKRVAPMTGLAALALSLALPALAADRDEGPVKRLGRTVMQWKDEAVQVVVSYRHADKHLDAPWILLQVGVSARGTKVAEISREDVLLVMPDGERLPLPSQKALAEGMPDLRRFLREVSISRDPIDGYFVGPTRFEAIQFFTVPGEGIVLDTFGISPDRLALGDLFFRAPKGAFPPGLYTLQIYNKGVDVKLPFRVPSTDPKDDVKDKDGKSVPW